MKTRVAGRKKYNITIKIGYECSVSPTPLLILNAVQLARAGKPLCAPIDKTLMAGDICLLTGPNGQGKSTLLKACAGWHRPQRGEITAQLLYYLGHKNPIQSALTVAENLQYYFEEKYQDIDIISKTLFKKPVDTLSAGQQRRLALAALWQPGIFKKNLWLLDEPGAALDDASLNILRKQLQIFAQQGGAVLMAVHQVEHWQHLLRDHGNVSILQLTPAEANTKEEALDAW